ncbi:hypothetical protein R3P38DRAFT_2804436 [Favolaschia claudopus]|uniref:Cysteine protease n=1 Tax=Favolaschia claudopus TaxID=2862362 RepID=A0AAV9ZQ70_9AGAR
MANDWLTENSGQLNSSVHRRRRWLLTTKSGRYLRIADVSGATSSPHVLPLIVCRLHAILDLPIFSVLPQFASKRAPADEDRGEKWMMAVEFEPAQKWSGCPGPGRSVNGSSSRVARLIGVVVWGCRRGDKGRDGCELVRGWGRVSVTNMDHPSPLPPPHRRKKKSWPLGVTKGWTSATGWGCMLRMSQSLLATALDRVALRRVGSDDGLSCPLHSPPPSTATSSFYPSLPRWSWTQGVVSGFPCSSKESTATQLQFSGGLCVRFDIEPGGEVGSQTCGGCRLRVLWVEATSLRLSIRHHHPHLRIALRTATTRDLFRDPSTHRTPRLNTLNLLVFEAWKWFDNEAEGAVIIGAQRLAVPTAVSIHLNPWAWCPSMSHYFIGVPSDDISNGESMICTTVHPLSSTLSRVRTYAINLGFYFRGMSKFDTDTVLSPPDLPLQRRASYHLYARTLHIGTTVRDLPGTALSQVEALEMLPSRPVSSRPKFAVDNAPPPASSPPPPSFHVGVYAGYLRGGGGHGSCVG